ncbi:MAG TPA: efflux RND transporter periplasmic adaptor subunit [Mariprofundaceae bacterium]|nr:efflux RND transporter periplasmic adaptor subunit [Mariprofundaceae bacterium]
MNRTTWIVTIAALAAGLAGGYFLAGGKTPQNSSGVTGSNAEKKILFYRNPMNPAITSPVPAKDEMGMDYIPVYAGGSSGNEPAGTVKIDPTTEQDIGVRLSKAVERNLSRTITTVGRITFDESRLVTLHPKVEGWINKLFVDTTGESVQQNTMLLSLYSPQLVATEEEYLLALSNWEQLKSSPYPDIRDGARRLLDSSLDRLRFFDVPEHQIRELQKTHHVMKYLHIHAPAAGVVTRIGVREGAHVTPASELYQIADLSHVWVLADLYEYEIGWVRTGDAATLHIDSLPGHDFRGRITYIYPYLDPQTRTNKVRIEFDNPDGLLKPDMFGDVTIAASSRKPGVYVPREAVLVTGKREHLFVRTAPGRFEPRDVRTGAAADGMVEILSGVKAGEEVVSSGQFLIDSESSIREAAAKMQEPSAGESKGTAASRPQDEGQEVPHSDATEPAAPDDMNMEGMSMDRPGKSHE